MAKTTPSVIFLRLNDEGSRPLHERLVDTAAKPGMLLKHSAGINFELQNATDSAVLPLIAIESPYFGENVGALAGTYAVDTNCRARVAQTGDEVYVLVVADGDIAVGDLLNAGGTGHWAEASTGAAMAVALEAATDTSAFLCRVMII